VKRGRLTVFAYEFLVFGIKQGWACLFGGTMLAMLMATHFWYPRDFILARYDFLVLASVVVQILFLAFRLETWEEAKVIFVFHLVGTGMEIFKIRMGSWIYPEPSLIRLWGVPLFTGFMYAAIGSYIARAGRLFEWRFTRFPPMWALLFLAVASYLNFFTHHFMVDARWLLFAMTAWLFRGCWVYYLVWRDYRRMPMLLGFLLVTLFIWFAENIGTFATAWLYPHQLKGWSVVSFAKFGSWFLLMIISFVLVMLVQPPQTHRRGDAA